MTLTVMMLTDIPRMLPWAQKTPVAVEWRLGARP